jgi:hypothetical protein
VGFVVEGEFEEAMAAVEVEFVANAEAMVFDGFVADAQNVGNFFAGAVFSDQFKDAAFGRGEFVDLRFAEEQGLDAITPAFAGMRKGRADEGLAFGDFLKGADDFFASIFFKDVGFDAHVHGTVEEVLIFIHGEKDDAHEGFFALELASHFEAVEAGHVDIEDDDVGLMIVEHFEGGLAVGGFADDFEDAAFFDDFAKTAAKDRVIVDDEELGFTHGDNSETQRGNEIYRKERGGAQRYAEKRAWF